MIGEDGRVGLCGCEEKCQNAGAAFLGFRAKRRKLRTLLTFISTKRPQKFFVWGQAVSSAARQIKPPKVCYADFTSDIIVTEPIYK